MTEHIASIIIGVGVLSWFVGFVVGFWVGLGDEP